MTSTILTPAAVLVLWTFVMLVWMAATRGPELRKLGTDKLKPGTRGADLEGVIDERANWKAHNYNHLHEQPTLFYATVMILALAGFDAIDVALAWARSPRRSGAGRSRADGVAGCRGAAGRA